MLLPIQFLLFIITISIVGFAIAYWYGAKTKKFRWSEYLLFIAAPTFGCLALSYFYGVNVLYLFLVFSITGVILEYGTGMAYHRILNKHLWTYGRFSLPGRYSSFLSLPLWGAWGVIAWLIGKQLGL